MSQEKKKRYVLRGQHEVVTVDRVTYASYYRMRRHDKYLKEVDEKHGLVSYQSLDTDEYGGEEIISDPHTDSVEDITEQNMILEKLRYSFVQLDADERDLIFELFWNQKTERQLSEQLGISQPIVNKRKRYALRKIRKIMEI